MPDQNVGLRLLVLGKTQAVAAMRELAASQAALNKTIRDGAAASKEAALSQDAFYAKGSKSLAQYRAEQAAASEAQLANVAAFGKRSAMVLGAATALITYSGIKAFGQYQTALTLLHTQAGMTVRAMNAVGAAARRIGPGLGVSPTDFVNAAYHPASAGFNTAATIAITTAAAKAAAVSGGSATLEDTTNALTGVMRSYNLGANKADQTIARLNAIVGAGNMRFGGLNEALASGVAATGSNFGVGLTSLGGALAFMTDRGIPAAQAGTHLRMSLALLGGPTKEATKILTAAGLSSSAQASDQSAMAGLLQQAGVSTTQITGALRNNSGAGGIYNALALLHHALDAGNVPISVQEAAITRAFGGGKMGSSIQMLYNNLPFLASKSAQINRTGSTAQFTKDTNMALATQQMRIKELGAAWHNFSITVGQVVSPVFKEFLQIGSGVLNFFAKNKAAVVVLGSVITAVLVPAIGVYLKRALLSNGGAVRSVIMWYSNWVRTILFGAVPATTAETAALGREDAALAANDASLAGNDAALGTNAAAARAAAVGRGLGRTGGLAGAFGAVTGGEATLGAATGVIGATAAVVGGLMYLDGAFNNSGKTPALGPVGINMADIARITKRKIPSVNPSTMAAIGNMGDLGSSPGFSQWVAENNARLATQPHVTVVIDGKKVFEAVATQARKTAARQ